MPFISKSFVSERLIPAVAIEKLIGQYLTLKKAGNRYTALCPFHHEKTPSFSVVPSMQMFYCFGCKEHGDAISFLMKYKNLGFVEAVEELARFAGLEVEYEKGGGFEKSGRYQAYYDLMERCADFYAAMLESPEGEAGRRYFTGRRGLSRETLAGARLGFAPDDWHNLDRILTGPQDEKLLVDLGMLVRGRGGKPCAMFRGRVMIPIFDRKGRIISFGGRTLGDDTPKYMNTRDSPIFRKRQELFGLYEALRDNNNRPERLVIVEGYMDVIAARQAGCSCAVASLGTATTAEQFRIMFRWTKRLICCYDGDSAGRAAAWRALNTATEALDEDCEIRFAFLPPEHDPDSLIREQGLEAFNGFLERAVSYPEFLVAHIEHDYDLADPGQRSLFISQALRQIGRIGLPPLREVTLELLAQRCGVESAQLRAMLREPAPQAEKTGRGAEASRDGLFKSPMRRLLAFILQQPGIASSQFQELNLKGLGPLCRKLGVGGADELCGLLEKLERRPGITTAGLLESYRGTPGEKYMRLLISRPLDLTLAPGRELDQVGRIERLAFLIAEVLLDPLRKRRDLLTRDADQITPGEADELETLQRQLQEFRTAPRRRSGPPPGGSRRG